MIYIYFKCTVMVLDRYYISKAHWQNALTDWMRSYALFGSVAGEQGLHMEKMTASTLHSLVTDHCRTVESPKDILFPLMEDLPSVPETAGPLKLVLGVRACDLRALAVLDRAFGGPSADPFYESRRKGLVLVGSDCTQPGPSCFCVQTGGLPYPTEGFDLNVAKLWDGMVVEVGTERGRALLDDFDRALKPTVKEEEDAQAKWRRETVLRVSRGNPGGPIPGVSEGAGFPQSDTASWEGVSSDCVECGACNAVCPTCHSYFFDLRGSGGRGFHRRRLRDACLMPGYDRSSRGEEERPLAAQRFRHRLVCKLILQPEQSGHPGCTGCGRCIDACPAGIDMRTVLRRLGGSAVSGETRAASAMIL
jgi:sulfhydrogenase subunit beta (sulfur reductase)